MLEIREIITRMDFRWDNGFITNQDEYMEQRLQLQQELDELTPIPTNEIEQAADILDNFPTHWQATNGDRKAQRELIQTIVERVYIEGKHVTALVLKPNYFVALDINKKSSEEINSTEDIHKREGQEPIRTCFSRRPRRFSELYRLSSV